MHGGSHVSGKLDVFRASRQRVPAAASTAIEPATASTAASTAAEPSGARVSNARLGPKQWVLWKQPVRQRLRAVHGVACVRVRVRLDRDPMRPGRPDVQQPRRVHQKRAWRLCVQLPIGLQHALLHAPNANANQGADTEPHCFAHSGAQDGFTIGCKEKRVERGHRGRGVRGGVRGLAHRRRLRVPTPSTKDETRSRRSHSADCRAECED